METPKSRPIGKEFLYILYVLKASANTEHEHVDMYCSYKDLTRTSYKPVQEDTAYAYVAVDHFHIVCFSALISNMVS